ncbi:MAG: hexitol phosphatase HxpB [Chitinophagaceae bacterium]|nr:hexitol phosphatase HxpB [Chitinophagaceae bacterium]
MKPDTFIFDMDGLLIDSEPLWEEAGAELLREFDIELTTEQYQSSTGLRTREWITHWFSFFGIDIRFGDDAVDRIVNKAIGKIDSHGVMMPGVLEIFEFLHERNFTIGLATSSPMSLVDVVVNKLGIRPYLHTATSAEDLPYGKPHPEVYLSCARELNKHPIQCICFEDSFNGMIAAKAARMKCVVVPAPVFQQQLKWNAADLQLKSLLDFGEKELHLLLS